MAFAAQYVPPMVAFRPPPGLELPLDGLPAACTSRGSARSDGSASTAFGIRPPPGLESPDESPRSRRPSFTLEGSAISELDMRECRTTLHIRNLPCSFKRATLVELMDAQGLAGQYDFVYLPMDFRTKKSIGYSFVNFRSSTAALFFRAAMDGFSQWPTASQKVCSVQWSDTQGLEDNVRLIIKSKVLKKQCPDDFKPTVFVGGKVAPFPRLE